MSLERNNEIRAKGRQLASWQCAGMVTKMTKQSARIFALEVSDR